MCETWKWDDLTQTFEVTGNVAEFNAMTDGLFIRYRDGLEVPYGDVVKGFTLLNQSDRIEKAVLRAAVEATGDESIMVVTQTRRIEMDLTKIDQPFGQLDIETKLALNRAFYEGNEIEWRNAAIYGWANAPFPSWGSSNFYRVRAEPMRDIELPWHVIRPEYKWAARDEDGEVWVFNNKPQISNDRDLWYAFGEGVKGTRANNLIHDPGNKPWNESLIQRPEGV